MRNDIITIVGKEMGLVSAEKVEGILNIKLDEAQTVIMNAIQNGYYYPLVTNKESIKSIVIMTNGHVYPSTFRAGTLVSRVKEATKQNESEY